MRRYRRLLSLLALFPLFAGCHLFEGEYVTPKKGPGTSYPCGYTGVECTDSIPHDCCPMDHACVSDDGGPYCEAQAVDPMSPYARRKRVPRSDLR